MATLKYILQSKSDNSNIYVRYSIDRKTILKRKTGFTINPKDWSIDKGQPKQSRDDLKALKSKLDKLAVFINDAYKSSKPIAVDAEGEELLYITAAGSELNNGAMGSIFINRTSSEFVKAIGQQHFLSLEKQSRISA